MQVQELQTLKVYALEPRKKHPTIFEWFDNLPPAGAFIIENDHDPIPLFYELKAERKDLLQGFDYLENGPEIWRVQITKSATEGQQCDTCSVDRSPAAAAPSRTLDVTKLEPRKKHATIFEWYENLQPGEAFTIHNDHDPKPLYYQMLGQLGTVFNWHYEEEGPEWWKVVIQKKNAAEQTVGEIAAKDMRKAEAMKKLGIDFCCGGGKTISQAAKEAGIAPEVLQKALEETTLPVAGVQNSFDTWDADFLADYIYNQHHKYYYSNRDEIYQLATKVRGVHQKEHPELVRLCQLLDTLFDELKTHFYKEEKVLFPYIKELAAQQRSGGSLPGTISLKEGPLAMMLAEHEAAGEILKEMRSTTNNYQVPEGGCNSYRLLYTKLEALENDLHQHIHLENNILFPKALQLEKGLAD